MKTRLGFLLLTIISVAHCQPLPPTLIINSQNRGYEYEIWLNEDPIYFSRDQNSARLRPDIFRNTNNKIEIRSRPYSKYANISISIYLIDMERTIEVCDFRIENSDKSETFSTAFSVESPAKSRPQSAHEILNESDAVSATNIILSLYAHGDEAEFHTKAAEALPTHFRFLPTWVTPANLKSGIVTAVLDSSEHYLITNGQTRSMVRSKSRHESGRPNSLASFNYLEHSASFAIDYIIVSNDQIDGFIWHLDALAAKYNWPKGMIRRDESEQRCPGRKNRVRPCGL